MIELKNIHKYYSSGQTKLHILKGINLTVHEGDFLSIMGASGSGKSTLLNILGILDYADEGSYYLNHELIHKLSENQAAIYRNRFIGFVFQSFSLIGYKNVKENVELPLYYQGVAAKERKERTKEILEKVGIADKLFALPNELSGGQQQRVAIARALITNPKVILADEPTGALDSSASNDLLDLFYKINEDGNTIIMVTHDKEMANRAKKNIYIKDGMVEEMGG